MPLSAEVREILLRLDRELEGDPPFVNPTTGARPSRGASYNRLRAACESVGILGIHPHSPRHTFGTRRGGGRGDGVVGLIERGVGLQHSG